MKLGIIGLPQSGKNTVFKALTGGETETGREKIEKGKQVIVSVRVADPRVDHLTEIYKPKKTIYSQVEYLLPPKAGESDSHGKEKENAMLNAARSCDALIQVVKNFHTYGSPPPSPERDFLKMESEMTLSDLMVIEKRLEKIESDGKKGREIDSEEKSQLKKCLEILSGDHSLRQEKELASSPVLKGFSFLTAKPELVISNNSDDDTSVPELPNLPPGIEVIVVRGKLEMELGEMPPEEAREFLSEFNVEESLIQRLIKASFKLCDAVCFFTVGENEVKSWTVSRDTPALDAAGIIHSDMKKGFIKAEVLPYDQIVQYGDFSKARKAGALRLEGKDYKVQDGDIVRFKFNV